MNRLIALAPVLALAQESMTPEELRQCPKCGAGNDDNWTPDQMGASGEQSCSQLHGICSDDIALCIAIGGVEVPHNCEGMQLILDNGNGCCGQPIRSSSEDAAAEEQPAAEEEVTDVFAHLKTCDPCPNMDDFTPDYLVQGSTPCHSIASFCFSGAVQFGICDPTKVYSDENGIAAAAAQDCKTSQMIHAGSLCCGADYDAAAAKVGNAYKPEVLSKAGKYPTPSYTAADICPNGPSNNTAEFSVVVDGKFPMTTHCNEYVTMIVDGHIMAPTLEEMLVGAAEHQCCVSDAGFSTGTGSGDGDGAHGSFLSFSVLLAVFLAIRP